jgi:hypothetical protein
MYEVARKQAYFASLKNTGSRKQFASIQKNVMPFEDKFGKGLSEFYPAQTMEFLNSYQFTRPEAIRQYLNATKRYLAYCGVHSCENLTILDYDIRSAMEAQLFKSFRELMDNVSQVVLAGDGNVVPVALSLAWIGVPVDNVCTLEASQVDLKSGVISVDGYKTLVTKDHLVLNTLRTYRNIAEAFRNQNDFGKVLTYKPLDTNYFLRKLTFDAKKEKTLYYKKSTLMSALSRVQQDMKALELKSNINYKDVQRSGELERVYHLEKNGVILSENKELVCDEFESNVTFKDIMFMYQSYKQAFNLD